MSRSYKKHPFCTDGTGKLSKKQANKIVRKRLKNINEDIGNGRHYKSLVESWDIRDYSWYQSERQAIADWEEDFAMGYTTITKEEALQNWAKWNKRK